MVFGTSGHNPLKIETEGNGSEEYQGPWIENSSRWQYGGGGEP